jgi:hypothetical protein
LIVLHAGTRSDGLIDGCDLVFLAKSKDGDHHQEMNSFFFLEWVENQLMPALKNGLFCFIFSYNTFFNISSRKMNVVLCKIVLENSFFLTNIWAHRILF